MIATRVAALALLAAPVLAQQPGAPQPPPTTQMVLKGKAPVSSEVLKVTLPKAKETTLPNGLRVVVLESRRVPQVSFQLIVPGAGGYFDPADRAGLSAWTAAMMREGTTTRSSTQISEALETMGASLFTSAGAGATNGDV